MLKRMISKILAVCILTLIVTLPIKDEGVHASGGTLKILAIGNSFTEDSTEWLPQIARNAGVNEIVVGRLVIGGCSLATHWSNASTNNPAYIYAKNTTGTWTSQSGKTLLNGLQDEAWDIIVIQQVSGLSGDETTYNSDLTNLISYINANKTNPNAKLTWNMTWAYPSDSAHADFPRYNNNQSNMYNAIVNAVQSKIVSNSSFFYIIPTGTAVQNVRTSIIGDTLNRDDMHLTLNLGRYIAAMTWLRKLAGVSIDNITYVPNAAEVPQAYLPIIKEAVNEAVQTPFTVTQSSNNLGNYKLADWQPLGSSYWVSTSSSYVYSPANSTATNLKYYISSKMFTKAELPVGSTIVVDEGYQYRPEGWVNLSTINTVRPDNVTTNYILVDNNWWGNYNYRAFNISKIGATTDLSTAVQQHAAHFKIIVPYPNNSVIRSHTNYWNFNENTGTTVVDSWSGVTGTISGASWTTGYSGSGLSFNGTSSKVNIGKADINGAWTASMWVKRQDSAASSAALLNSTSGSLKIEQFNNTNKVGITKAGVADYTFNYTAPVGQWANLTFTCDGVNTNLYVNGVYKERIAAAIALPMNTMGDSFSGVIDDVKIFDRMLSPGEVANQMPAGVVSLSYDRFESYNFPGSYMRAINCQAHLEADASITPFGDSQWRIVPGLADPTCVSIESVSHPGFFLRHQNAVIYYHQYDGSNLFKQDATFRIVPGLKDSNCISFQSYNFPNSYIRHKDGYWRIDAVADDLGRQDATYMRHSKDPVGYWKLDETSGTTTADSSGSGNNGTVYNGTWVAAGHIGGALSFNGTSSYVTVNRQISDDFTISFWVKTTQTGGTGAWYAGRGLVDGETVNVVNDFGISLLGVKLAFGVGNPDTTITSTTNINDGTWKHCLVTRKKSTGAIKIYINGILEASGTGGTQLLSAPANIRFGSIRTGTNFFNGQLDDIRIYNRVLTDTEIAALAAM